MSPTAKTTKTTPVTKSEAVHATNVIATWVATLSVTEAERFNNLFQNYKHTPYPTICALLAFFGVDPNTVPANNTFFVNGFITFRERVQEDENTPAGYREVAPKLNDYPEGLKYEVAQAAQRYDAWGIL